MPTRITRNVNELIAALGAIGPGEPSGMRLVVERATELLQADRGVAYSLRPTETGIETEQLEGHRVDTAIARQVLDGELKFGARPALAYDPARPAPEQRNRPVTLKQIVSLNGGKAAKLFDSYGKMGVGGVDQLRVLVCEGPVLLGYVSSFRGEPFQLADVQLYRRLVQPLRQRLVIERHLGQFPVYFGALHASLEAMPTEAFLIKSTPNHLSVVEANQLGRMALQRDQSGVLGQLRQAAKGLDRHTFTLTRLALPDLPPHFLAVRKASNVDQLPARLSRLQREWRLTAKQTAVLGRLATGLSNKSIALELGCAEGTIETHVTALLNKSATESRAELIARFWTTG